MLGIKNRDNAGNAGGEDTHTVKAGSGKMVIDGDWCADDDDPRPYEVNRRVGLGDIPEGGSGDGKFAKYLDNPQEKIVENEEEWR